MAGALSVSLTLILAVIDTRSSDRCRKAQGPLGMAHGGLVLAGSRDGYWIFGLPYPWHAPELGNHCRHVRFLKHACNRLGALGYR